MLRGLHHKPGTDPASPVRERRIHDLEASPALRDNDAAARGHFIACGVDSDVPTAMPGAEVFTKVGEASSGERSVVVLSLSRIPILDLKLDDRRPEPFVRVNRRIEAAHCYRAVRSTVLPQSIGLSDEADALVEVVAVAKELFARGSERAVGAVPRERPVPNLGFDGELGVEERLPAIALARAWWLIEEQIVAPVVRRVAGRADGEVAVSSLDATIDRQHVKARRPHERSRSRYRALSVAAHAMETRGTSHTGQTARYARVTTV